MLPKFLLVRNNKCDLEKIKDLKKEFWTEISKFNTLIEEYRGKKIGIAVGSRGIDKIDLIVKLTVDSIKKAGAIPVVFGAMGSHGGGTAQGQKEILESLGIVEEKVGAPVICNGDSIYWGETDDNKFPVYGNPECSMFDGVVLINRVKMHTDFEDITESGVIKLMSVGIGNPIGCRVVHSLAMQHGYGTVIREIAEFMKKKLNVLFGIMLIENSVHQLRKIVAECPDQFVLCETELLKEVKKNKIMLPVKGLDVLILNQIGKDISGTGMDTNIIGRTGIMGKEERDSILCKRIVVLNLTEKSHGNAIGIGLADLTTMKVFNKMNLENTVRNAISSMSPEQGKIPCIEVNDKTAISSAIFTSAVIDISKAYILYIKDTNHTNKMYISEGLYCDKLKNIPDIEVLSEPMELQFDKDGNLMDMWNFDGMD